MTDTLKLGTNDRRPNVIWVFGDQHRAQALGYRDDPNAHTPNIDRLARDGVRFDAAVAGAPWCSPFRGALLTGMYPNQNGVTQTPSALDPSIPTIATPFREAGYHTAYVGKWHVDGSNSRSHYVPPQRRGGFDYWLGYENCNAQYDVFVYGSDNEEPTRLDGYETDALTDRFVAHLEQRVQSDVDQPFFGVLSVQPPHDPYTAPADFSGRRNAADIQFRPNVPDVPWVRDKAAFDLSGYYAQIENLDWNLGRLRDALRRLNIDRETYICFFSDHGDCHGSHAYFHKSSPWEESIRIPCLIGSVHGSGLSRGGVCDAVVNHVDLAPTTLGLCGITPPSGMVGFDYSRNVVGKGRPEYRDEPQRIDEPDSAYLQQIPAKLHKHGIDRPWRGIVTRDGWKYVVLPHQPWLMFNLNDDPYELANVAHNTAFADKRQALHERLAAWVERTGDDFVLPSPTHVD